MPTTIREWVSGITTVLLVISALAVTGVVVRRELFSGEERSGTWHFAEWRSLLVSGHRIGARNAPVQVVVFFDYQCPFCQRVEASIETLVANYGDQIAVTYRHFPLDQIHPQARAAAVAAECAAEQGRFHSVHEVLFANTDHLGVRPWEELAAEAGVGDLHAFSGCIETGQYADRLAKDQSAAEALGILSIPTLVINGTVVTGAKPLGVLEELVIDVLRGLD